MEGGEEGVGGLVAGGGVLGEEAVDDVAERRGDIGGDFAERRGLLLGVLEDQLGGGCALVGRAAGEEVVEGGAERVEVAAGVERLAPRGLGRHVEGRAERGAGGGDADVHALVLGEAEVSHLRVAFGVEQYVRGLDVAVQDAAAMRLGEGRGHLLEELDRAVGRERALAAEQVVQVLAVDELHGDVADAAGLAHGVDLHDVGMLDGRGGAGLALEAGDEAAVGGEALGEDLDGDEAVEGGLPRLVDGPHAASAEDLHDLELAEGRANERIGGLRR